MKYQHSDVPTQEPFHFTSTFFAESLLLQTLLFAFPDWLMILEENIFYYGTQLYESAESVVNP